MRQLLVSERGQGTVEYVGLMLVVALVMGGAVLALKSYDDDKALGTAVMKKIKGAVDAVKFPDSDKGGN